MATVEQSIQALNLQLNEANAQITIMSNALDTLRTESVAAVLELRRQLASSAHTSNNPKNVKFINTKTFEGGKFAGGVKESFKAWAKKVKIFLNSQHRGMRQALEVSEEAGTKVVVGDLKGLDWQFAVEANEMLYDFLMTFTSEEALRVVEPYVSEGFEAWRQLKLRYTLVGGTTAVDRTIRLFSKKACKSLSELPAAIDFLDKEIRADEEASGHKLPDHTKLALLVRLFPEKDEKDMKHRWVHGQKNFEKVRADILAMAVNERLEVTNRGVKDMEVDALADEKAPETEESWTAKEWLEWTQEEEQLDYMAKGKGGGKKGGGKGKGWRAPGQWNGSSGGGKDGAEGKGSGKDGKDTKGGKGKGKETRACHWCKKIGHLKPECRSWLAGKPKTLASLEAEWEEDCGSCCQCDALSEHEESEQDSADEESGWMPETEAAVVDSAPLVLDPWSSYRLAKPALAFGKRSGVPGVIDILADEPAGETPGMPNISRSESVSDIIRRRQAELQKKIDEILGNTAVPLVPTPPPGMARQKGYNSQRCPTGHKARIATLGKLCCSSAEASAQTEVSLPHDHRDVLWTASSLAPVADFDDDNTSVVIESSASSPSVLDIDIIEAVQYDDDDDLDDAKNVGSEPDNSDAGADDPDETNKFDDAVDANDESKEKAESNFSAIAVMPMFLIVLASASMRRGAVIESLCPYKTSKSNKKKREASDDSCQGCQGTHDGGRYPGEQSNHADFIDVAGEQSNCRISLMWSTIFLSRPHHARLLIQLNARKCRTMQLTSMKRVERQYVTRQERLRVDRRGSSPPRH